ncbi:MAG: membrane dipeptidase [Tepidisphaeraceae bacterium]
MIVDAHLDLADNAVRGRPVHLPARMQKPDEDGIPTVGLPDLRRGGVGLICATIFCQPRYDDKPGYQTPDEAHAAALTQLDWYRSQQSAGTMRILQRPADFSRRVPETQAILLMEGADPLRDETDVRNFFESGLRIVGLTWKEGTHYAGGNARPGPLTRDGAAMVKTLDRLGIIHDLSHLADEAFWQLLALSSAPVMASHSNCRSIVPGERQLSDEMIRAIASRGGMIGINFFDRFLVPPQEQAKRRAILGDVTNHVKHVCDIAGDAAHVGLGTDMDGGLGRDEIPVEIETSADLPRVADALSTAGFGDQDIAAIMGENWLRFFSKNLRTPNAK